jgi:hypothetical protein
VAVDRSLQLGKHVVDEVLGRVAVADARPHNLTASGLGSSSQLRLRLAVHGASRDHREQPAVCRYRGHRFIAPADSSTCSACRIFSGDRPTTTI